MASSIATDRPFIPVPVINFDVDDPGAADLCLEATTHAFLVARYHGEPLGTINVHSVDGTITRQHVLAALADDTELAQRLAAHREQEADDGAHCRRFVLDGPAPDIAIVIPTRNRADSLHRCLGSIARLDYDNFTVVVVDNGSTQPTLTAAVVEEFAAAIDVRMVEERRPGASIARNTGAAEVDAGIVAFCDDDVLVDSMWLRAIAARFELEPEAQCVTGLVAPGELQTPAQLLFEEYGGFGKGSVPRSFDLFEHADPSPLFPWTAGRFGSGNNVAYRRSTLVAIGGYDPLLGPGTPTHAGEDLDVFLRLVLGGHRIAYEPSALVSHFHRRTMVELSNQLHEYGTGLSAMLCLRACSEPKVAASLARRVGPGARLLLSPSSAKNAKRTQKFPRRLASAELKGFAKGPAALVRARRRSKATVATRVRARVTSHLAQPMFRNAWALVLNTGLTGVFGVAYWAVAARLYSASAVGTAAAMVAAMGVLSGIAQLNLISGLPRFLPTAGRLSRRLVLLSYGVTAALALIVATAFVAINRRTGLGGTFLDGSPRLALWFIAAVGAWTIFTLQDSVLAGLRAAVWVPLENGLFGLLKIVLAVVFVSLAPRNGLFASWTIPTLLAIVPINILLFAKLLPASGDRATRPPMQPLVRRMARLVSGDYPGSLAYLASITAMPILVARVVGFDQAAYFYTAWMLATSADLVLSAIATSVTVEGAHDLRSFSQTVGKAVRLYAAVLIPLVTALVLGAHLVLGIFGTGYQHSATGLLQLVALTLPARAVIHLSFASYRVDGRPRAIFVVQLASGVGLIAGAMLLLAPMGIAGVGLAYFLSQWAIALVLVPKIRRRQRDDVHAVVTLPPAVEFPLAAVRP